MARKLKEDGQLELIATTHPQFQPLKSAIRAYNSRIDEKNAAAKQAKDQRRKILDIIKETGIAPNIDGIIEFKMGDVVIKIEPGESKLHIKEDESGEDEGDGDPDEQTAAEGAEQETRRGRPGKV